MDVSRLFLIVAAALGLAITAAQAQDKDTVSARSAQARGPAKPWRFVRGLGRVLDLSKPPVVIDEPGLYAIQQSWRFPRATTDVVSELIQITADDVTLDLHGFTISTELIALQPSTLFAITGDSAEIRNGGITAHDGALPCTAPASGQWLHHLSVSSGDLEITFEG